MRAAELGWHTGQLEQITTERSICNAKNKKKITVNIFFTTKNTKGHEEIKNE